MELIIKLTNVYFSSAELRKSDVTGDSSFPKRKSNNPHSCLFTIDLIYFLLRDSIFYSYLWLLYV